ncbi:MAG: hypothetical protein HY290_04325 [Planctomycetia bacterium]|nr:hypothetical protein [Planctomycetia bacterium]
MISDPRHRAQYRQLWIDKVRDEMDKCFSPADFERMVKIETLARLSGPNASLERIRALSLERLGIEFMTHDLVDPLPAVVLRTLKARGYPQRELGIPEDWPACEAKVCGALNWCAFDILRNPASKEGAFVCGTNAPKSHDTRGR